MSDSVAAVAAVVTASVLAIQMRLLLVQARQERVAIANRMSDRWSALQTDWHRSAMVIDGPMAYYPVIPGGERLDYRELLGTAGRARQRASDTLVMTKALDALIQEGLQRGRSDESEWDDEFIERLETELWTNLAVWLPIHERDVLASADLRVTRLSVRRVLEYLSELSGQIFRGELSPQLAYEILGAQIARNGGMVRRMMKNQQEWVSIQPGLQLRILSLVDLMWAEGARIGELLTQPNPNQVAEHKKASGSGRAARKRVAMLVRRVSHKPRLAKEWKVLQLTDLLREAEKPASVIEAPYKYEPFRPADDNELDAGWLLTGKRNDLRVGWLQAAINRANEGDESIGQLVAVLGYLQDIREANEGAYRWWVTSEEE